MSESREKIGGFDADLPLAAVAKESIDKERQAADEEAKRRAQKLAAMEEDRELEDGRGGMRHEQPQRNTYPAAMRRFREAGKKEDKRPSQVA